MGCFDQVLEKITLRLSKKLCQVPKNNSQYWVKNNGNFHYFLLSAENYFLKIHCFLGIFTQRKIMVLHDQDLCEFFMIFLKREKCSSIKWVESSRTSGSLCAFSGWSKKSCLKRHREETWDEYNEQKLTLSWNCELD